MGLLCAASTQVFRHKTAEILCVDVSIYSQVALNKMKSTVCKTAPVFVQPSCCAMQKRRKSVSESFVVVVFFLSIDQRWQTKIELRSFAQV